MPIHAYFFRWAILTRKVGQTGLQFLARDQGSLVGPCVQDYKSLLAPVTICSTLVNILTDTQTHAQTAFDQLVLKGQPAELEIVSYSQCIYTDTLQQVLA